MAPPITFPALDRFLSAANAQKGDKYKFGAEANPNDANPDEWDSSELVEWAAHQAGVDLPDGSWNQYRHLHDAGGSLPVEQALKIPGALVFGFSSDPLASAERPARAYVGISLGNGKVLDISERGGEVREMDPGDFYSYGAVIPGIHDTAIISPAVGPSQPPDPSGPVCEPEEEPDPPKGEVCEPEDEEQPEPPKGGVCEPEEEPQPSRGPDGRIIHEPLPEAMNAQFEEVLISDRGAFEEPADTFSSAVDGGGYADDAALYDNSSLEA